MSPKRPLDRIDVALLRSLQNDGRRSNKELAADVGLAPSSCHERLRRLRADGVLRGVHADVDPRAMGVGLQAIVAIVLRDQSRPVLERFLVEVPRLPEVVAVFNVGGEVDYLLHVMVRDTDHLRDLVLERLASRPEVRQYTTSLIFQEIRGAAVPCYLPLAGAG